MAEYVLKPTVVEKCIWCLARTELHRHFPGYLGVKRASAKAGTSTNFSFNYNEFFDAFFQVRDEEEAYPYLIPFNRSENPDPDSDSMWLNPNVAGSYGPSSVRSDQPFEKVVEVTGSGRSAEWSLRDDHWELARQHLCYSQQVPAEYLAGFLFRDFSIEMAEPSTDGLIQAYQEVFGYDSEGEEFQHLYTTDSSDIDADSFEEL